MSTRVRQSTAAPSQRRSGNEPPPYEKPTFPLNPAAQRSLGQLLQTHTLNKLDGNIVEAQKALSGAAGDINDRLTAKDRAVQKQRQAHSSSDGPSEAGDDLEQRLAELRDKVDRMTQRMDESMRKMIDGRHSLQSAQGALEKAAQDARLQASTQASAQNIRPQRQRRRNLDDGSADGEDDDDEYQDFEPTDPTAGTQGLSSALEKFKTQLDDAKTRYQSHSLTARYADNNEYRDFRRVVHDAKHPDGDVQLAHHTEWFHEGDAPAPGVTTRGRANAEDDDDDDIAVARATISTKCPLTLQELKSPLTSRKCPHSFEAEAILSMITGSSNREQGRPNGERYVQCPVTGCSQTLTRGDLHTDSVLVRRIKRLQRARELQDDDAEDEHNGGGPRSTVIEDVDEDAADVDDIVAGRVIQQTQMKSEPKGTRSTVPPASSARVVDLGSSSDEEEADEDEIMEE
ncbi:zinc-finger of the MIZ type in Nse subunit-domain-containing protein [Neohortaea acidophila]|uniref:Zinc-finger of the MIZ type in Nse subunit-domain-containing protein n=1 Tax=Neohortaea acidophila TaxID=245834 RepID=A0A6A6Q140_9PEZI|nr:zinc-finger of the MIZ type in Nse subunit-domain-containing protein [Neohortaea acidophila]KAF2485393.1 zinc-finger of the MIZ type in Nse subunit-domain-containing protein [Neohortaea acidophila]